MSWFNWVIGDRVAKYLGRIAVGKNSLEGLSVTSVSEGSTTLFTAEMLLGGMILYDPSGSTANATLPTAALIVAALGDAAIVGTAFKFRIRHTGSGSEVVTLVAGSDMTLSPTTLNLDGNEILDLLCRIDNITADSEAVTVYGLGLSLMTT